MILPSKKLDSVLIPLITTAARYMMKPVLGSTPFAWQRAWIKFNSKNTGMSLPDTQREHISLDGIPTLKTFVNNSDTAHAVLYLHGGAFCVGSAQGYQHLASHLAESARTNVYAIDYRLAPEDPYPAQVEDAVRAYENLLKRGYLPENISVAGDSAGGGLVLLFAFALKNKGLAQPASLGLISPWVDFAGNAKSRQTHAKRDPLLRAAWTQQCYAAWLGTQSPPDLLNADYAGIAPMVIQVGSEEILYDDSLILHELAKKFGVLSDLKIFDGLWHVFQVHAGLLACATEAVHDLGCALRAHHGA